MVFAICIFHICMLRGKGGDLVLRIIQFCKATDLPTEFDQVIQPLLIIQLSLYWIENWLKFDFCLTKIFSKI